LDAEEYREEYFRHPEDLIPKFDREFKTACVERLRETVTNESLTDDSVLAVHGVAGLYGFTFLHEILKAVEPQIRGRVVVFFPGSYDQNSYRLLDARDGWNYMATPITGLASK
jgi:hypothetical protein